MSQVLHTLPATLAGRRPPAAAVLPAAAPLMHDGGTRAILSTLAEPQLAGALVVGGIGMGKSFLGREAGAALEGSRDVRWLQAHQLLAGVPFGVLELFLAMGGSGQANGKGNSQAISRGTPGEAGGGSGPEWPAGHPMALDGALARTTFGMVQAMHSSLQSHIRERGAEPLLVVDNAQWIDAASCAVLEQLALSGTVKMLLLCRPGSSPVAGSLLFTDDTLLAQHHLSLLGPAQVHAACESRLGGKVLASTADALAGVSGGHPLFLQAVIDAALQAGALGQHHGVWRFSRTRAAELQLVQPYAVALQPAAWETAASRLTEPLGELAVTVLREFTEEEQGLLETVALAEPVPLGLLRSLFPAVDMRRVADGLLTLDTPRPPAQGAQTINDQARRLVSLAAPVLGHGLRERIPPGRSRQLQQRVEELQGTAPLTSGALLGRARWSLDTGSHISDRQLLQAARIANARNNPTLALRLAAAVTNPDADLGADPGADLDFAARQEMALSHIALHHYTQAGDIVEPLLNQARTKGGIDAVAGLAVVLGVLEGFVPAKLEAAATAWRAVYAQLRVPRMEGAGLVDALVAINAGEQLDRWQRAALEQAGRDGEYPEVRFAATALLAQDAAMEGDDARAHQDFVRARQLLAEHPGRLGVLGNILTGWHLLFLFATGAHGQALAMAREIKAEGPQGQGVPGSSGLQGFGRENLDGVVGLVEALAAMGAGRLGESLVKFDSGLAALGDADPVRVLPFAQASAAYACALAGDVEKSAALAAEFAAGHAEKSVGEGLLWLLSRSYAVGARAMTAGPQGERATQKAWHRLQGLAEKAHHHGSTAVELAILDILLRSGCTEMLQRMADISREGDGPAAAMMHRMAHALLAGDPVALERVAAMPQAAHNAVLGAEALAYALRIYTERGDAKGRAGVMVELRELKFPLQAVGSAPVAELAVAAGLTPREREIALLVHEGRSNRDIAEIYTISQRTVEGHLYRIYSKLGVGSREELHADWLPELLEARDG
ncbi:helix-turn-helix transcriptional regulator [Arthrobacter sp. A2-55]|uniref:helix-turn-helix transcriptional regulator n=1 Tax=Arthrobacter sp. A2-55 TaxID=2897337 RepID=UPI0021CD6777|nr:LuxR family transcriptional regulator [Arthrobacter sp. A2-55]MCU6479891.1 LuxR C-terminal-related transcriptional regulator [Arthrobacter sp. A2-55]